MPPLPPPLTGHQLDNIQGDIWSRGFLKYYETYYFFSIKQSNANIFAQCLKDLATHSPPLISTLRKVRDEYVLISKQKEEAAAAAKKRGIPEKDVNLPKIPISNALIAFTSKGLKTVSYPIRGIHHQVLSRLRYKLAFKQLVV
jgi:hypothetical protein